MFISAATVYLFVVGALLLVVLSYVLLGFYLVTYMEQHHKDLWREIGSPNLVKYQFVPHFNFYIFFLMRRYSTIKVKKTRVLFDILWTLHATAIILFIINFAMNSH